MTPEERKKLVNEIASALQPIASPLSDEENRWVKMAIQKEAQSIALRKAIIEKTVSSLAWAALVGLGYLLLDGLRLRGIVGT